MQDRDHQVCLLTRYCWALLEQLGTEGQDADFPQITCRKDQAKTKGAAYGDIVKDAGRPREVSHIPGMHDTHAFTGTAVHPGSFGFEIPDTHDAADGSNVHPAARADGA